MRQDTREWLAWRNCGIGASDAPAILGVSPWKTAYQLWLEKTGKVEPPPANAAMERGKALEAEARAAYEFEHPYIMQPGTFEHPEWPVMRCSVDGISFDGECVVEIKCPGGQAHAHTFITGEVPPHYVAQCQHILAVTQAKVLHYFSYGDTDHVLIPVYPNSSYIASLMEAERDFWKCVVDDTPPPLTERDVIERTDEVWVSAALNYRATEAAAAEWAAKKDAAKELLVSLAGEAARVSGGGVTLTKYAVQGRVDYAAIPELQEVDLDAYRKPGQMQWRVSIEKK